MAYQVFISFKNLYDGKPTRDSEIAQELYNELKLYGVEVFFSNEEVQRKGRPDYGRLIDKALEEASVLILVGTRAEFTSSRWVEYEWDLFNNEIYSARKNGKIITVLEGMDVGELPIGMRRWQSYDLLRFTVSDAVKMAVNTLSELTGKSFSKESTYSSDSHSDYSSPFNEVAFASVAEVLFNTASDYYHGKNGKEQNVEEAVRYYRASAEHGYAPAQNSLGYCYQFGQGVPKDLQMAMHYYRLAADQGFPKAIHSVGYNYFHGYGVAADKAEGIRYYRMAADKGNARSLYNLALCYHYGDGVEQNLEEALKYYMLAAEQGHEKARNYLDSLMES